MNFKHLLIFGLGLFIVGDSFATTTRYKRDYKPYIRIDARIGSTSDTSPEALYTIQESWLGAPPSTLTSSTGAGIGGTMDIEGQSTRGIGLGFGFDFGHFRMDFNYENRGRNYDGTLRMYEKLGFNGDEPYTELNFEGDIVSHLMMMNLFLQGKHTKDDTILPYIGIGVGFAKHKIDDVVQHDNNPYATAQMNTVGVTVPVPPGLTGMDTPVDAEISGSSTVWSFMTGLNFYLGDGLILDLGYRYLDMGDVTVRIDRYRAYLKDNLNDPAYYESYREIKDHEIPSKLSEFSLGIRLAF